MAGSSSSSSSNRRGKKESSAAAAKNKNGNNKQPKNNSNEVATELEEQLNRAEASVQQNKLSTQVLHRQWKRHLQNLSYLLIILSFMQLKNPSVTCLQDIKTYNNNAEQEQEEIARIISGQEAIWIVLSDSVVPIMAIFMSAALSLFLIQTATVSIYTGSQFSNPSFTFASVCIPPILAVQQLQAKGEKEGCIDDLLQKADMFPSETELQQRPSRGFPVVLVFHVIVTLCFLFMESQMKLHERGMAQVEILRKDLHNATTGASTSKKDGDDNDKPTESKKSK